MSHPHYFMKKAQYVCQNKGFPSLLLLLSKKVLSLMLSTNTSLWLIRNLMTEYYHHKGYDNYEICFDHQDTIIEWIRRNNRIFPWMYSHKEIAVARMYNHIIPFIKHHNRIIGYTKVALEKVYLRDYDSSFDIAPDKAMFYDTTILPEYRGKKLPRFLNSEVFVYLMKRNIKYVYAHIEPWNIPSIKYHRAIGFKTICQNRYIRVFGLKHHSNNPSKLLS